MVTYLMQVRRPLESRSNHASTKHGCSQFEEHADLLEEHCSSTSSMPSVLRGCTLQTSCQRRTTACSEVVENSMGSM